LNSFKQNMTSHHCYLIRNQVYICFLHREKKKQVQKKPNNTDSCPVAYITTLTCIILKQIPNTFKSFGYTRLKNDLKRHRMCIRRFSERRIINGMCGIRTNVKSPLNKSSVQEHRPVDRSHIKKNPITQVTRRVLTQSPYVGQGIHAVRNQRCTLSDLL